MLKTTKQTSIYLHMYITHISREPPKRGCSSGRKELWSNKFDLLRIIEPGYFEPHEVVMYGLQFCDHKCSGKY